MQGWYGIVFSSFGEGANASTTAAVSRVGFLPFYQTEECCSPLRKRGGFQMHARARNAGCIVSTSKAHFTAMLHKQEQAREVLPLSSGGGWGRAGFGAPCEFSSHCFLAQFFILVSVFCFIVVFFFFALSGRVFRFRGYMHSPSIETDF